MKTTIIASYRATFVLIALCGVACGDDGAGPDAAPPDAAPGGDVSAPGEAVVTVYDEGMPVAGVPVIFHEPDGAVAEVMTTGGDGKATREVTAGAMVTVLRSPTEVSTFAAIEPGDELVVGDPRSPPTAELVTTADLTPPGVFPGASHYVVHLGCNLAALGDPSTRTQLPVYWPCVTATNTFTTLVLALDAEAEILAHSFVTSVSAEIGGITPVVLPPWSTAEDTLTVELSDAPDPSTSVVVDANEVAGGVAFALPGLYSDLTPGGGASFAVPRPDGFGDRFQLGLSVLSGTIDDSSSRDLFRQYAQPPETVTIALDDALLPRVHGLNLQLRESDRPLLAWQQDGALGDTDGGIAALDWEVFDGKGISLHSWRVLLPPGETEFQLPELPEEFADYRVSDSSEITNLALALHDIDYVAGYAALRNDLGMDIDRGIHDHLLETGANATIRSSHARHSALILRAR